MSAASIGAKQDDIRLHNMDYLRLDAAQYDRHCILMALAIRDWPPGLAEYVRPRSRRDGFSGDALSSWVAEWVRAGEPGGG